MKTSRVASTARLRLSVQADMLSSQVGGGRFIRGFLTTLFSEPDILDQFDRVYVVVTQNESLACLGHLPSNVSVVKRRFPSRLRQTPFGRLFGYALPVVDVSFGPFYHLFPSRSRAQVITVHDLSFLNHQYHPPAKARKITTQVTMMVRECDGVVCSSDATLCEFKNRWPHLAHKAVRIYCGVSPDGTLQANTRAVRERSILAVGTIEPRKNYPTLLDAFERLVNEQGYMAPALTVLGNMGWMSQDVGRRLTALESAGRCRWLRNASDEQLIDAYARAGVFTYLSLCEGFGYPPFEAALARCPMVLSNASSVGEIWRGHARCVDPLDVEGIVAGWKWALALAGREREAVIASQETRVRAFTWSQTVKDYMAFWEGLVRKDNTGREC